MVQECSSPRRQERKAGLSWPATTDSKEYQNYHSKPKAKKKRAQNNKARRKMVREGRARKGDGKDVAHKDNNTSNNSSSNLELQSKRKNRSFRRNRRAGRR